jgi:hypothetical protein
MYSQGQSYMCARSPAAACLLDVKKRHGGLQHAQRLAYCSPQLLLFFFFFFFLLPPPCWLAALPSKSCLLKPTGFCCGCRRCCCPAGTCCCCLLKAPPLPSDSSLLSPPLPSCLRAETAAPAGTACTQRMPQVTCSGLCSFRHRMLCAQNDNGPPFYGAQDEVATDEPRPTPTPTLLGGTCRLCVETGGCQRVCGAPQVAAQSRAWRHGLEGEHGPHGGSSPPHAGACVDACCARQTPLLPAAEPGLWTAAACCPAAAAPRP